MNRKIAPKTEQLGQTLIETVVAIFILVVGLISALSLAIYSFESADNSSAQITATALARQQIEIIKNMRDTNWLNDSTSDCSTDMNTTGPQLCYPNWLGGGANTPYAISNNLGTQYLSFDPTTNVHPFSFYTGQGTVNLYYSSSNGLYGHASGGGQTIFSGNVSLTENTSAPFTAKYPQLIATSTIWWSGRTCPSVSDPTQTSPACKVILVQHFTNWRNY